VVLAVVVGLQAEACIAGLVASPVVAACFADTATVAAEFVAVAALGVAAVCLLHLVLHPFLLIELLLHPLLLIELLLHPLLLIELLLHPLLLPHLMLHPLFLIDLLLRPLFLIDLLLQPLFVLLLRLVFFLLMLPLHPFLHGLYLLYLLGYFSQFTAGVDLLCLHLSLFLWSLLVLPHGLQDLSQLSGHLLLLALELGYQATGEREGAHQLLVDDVEEAPPLPLVIGRGPFSSWSSTSSTSSFPTSPTLFFSITFRPATHRGAQRRFVKSETM
jgi:hypothetical protein